MTWLLWRQHRVQLAIAVALLAAFALPMWLTGVHLADTYTSCRASSRCSNFDLFQHYKAMPVLVNLTVAVPLLIGVFWGATVVGREFEAGTATLVWTQSVTRSHWLRAKLVTLFLASLLVSAALAALVTWWSGPHNATVQSRFDGLEFDIQGVVPVAYTVFAAALGLAAGVLWRRVLPAMATTIGGFVLIRLVVELVARPHYMAPATALGSLGPSTRPSGEWSLGSDVLLHGHVVGGAIGVPGACRAAATRESMAGCLARLGYRLRTTYQPAGRYWDFQWIEAGIFLGLALLLVAAAVITLRRHDA